MTRIRFLSAWCLALLASACVAHADRLMAAASDCVDLGSTDSCSTCGADVCSCSELVCDQAFLFPQRDSGVNLRGWVAAGFVGNTSDPNSRFNGPYNAVDRSNEPMLNQLYLIGERALPECGWGLGVRVDMMYGEDFFLAQSAGLELYPSGQSKWNPEYYGLAFPQAYVNFGDQDLSFQVGHFYSIVGYEGLMAPSNFFYSKSYSYQFGGPFQHWGGQVNYNLNSTWSLQLGLVNGWNALDRESDDLSFIGRIKYENVCTGVWSSFALITGKEFNNAAQLNLRNQDYENRTRYSWLVGLPLTCRMEYVFHHYLALYKKCLQWRDGLLVRRGPVPLLHGQRLLEDRLAIRVVPRRGRHARRLESSEQPEQSAVRRRLLFVVLRCELEAPLELHAAAGNPCRLV